MTRKEIEKYIKNMNADELVILCREINEWRYTTGEIKFDSAFSKLGNDLKYFDSRYLENMILDAAHEKFSDVISLLLKSNPGKYIK